MRLSTSLMYQQSVSTMLNQQSALAITQNQVSTGKRINVASDDPAGAGQVLSLDHILAVNDQYSGNIDSATNRLSIEQTVLSSVGNLLDSARSMAIQGINGSLSGSDRSGMATQLGQLRDQLVQLANAGDSNGNALFAGTSTTTTPFVEGAGGVVGYVGNDAIQMASVGPGLKVPTSDAGSGLFVDLPAGNGTFTASAGAANAGTLVVGANSVTDPAAWSAGSAANGGSYTITFGAGGSWAVTNASGNPVLDGSGNPVVGTYQSGGSIGFNGMTLSLSGTPASGDTVQVRAGGRQDVFATLDSMIATLQGAGRDAQVANQLSRQIESLDQAKAGVTNAEVSIGGRLNTLGQQQAVYQNLKVTYQQTLSSVQNVDIYTAIGNLSSQSAALQASQQAFAKVNSTTLFDYIK
ncbi:MAG: flagellar hook-associated protein FlgL [Xanthomonadaceae bacterium]|nr:flagellar hook-associated protein FlgL [Xanthomonadaceae bacterium]